jgi:hypothetical protein
MKKLTAVLIAYSVLWLAAQVSDAAEFLRSAES